MPLLPGREILIKANREIFILSPNNNFMTTKPSENFLFLVTNTMADKKKNKKQKRGKKKKKTVKIC